MISTTRPAMSVPSLPTNTIFNRTQAQQRLHLLKPGTSEYEQVQNGLLKAQGIVEVKLPHSSYKINSIPPDDRLIGGFGSSEHIEIGKNVSLPGLPTNAPLLTKGLTSVFFSDIVALAGDFYGIPGQPISLPGGTDEEKTIRFEKALETLTNADDNEVRRILIELHQEHHSVHRSSLPHNCYTTGLMAKNKAIKKIKKDIEELLIDNSDHFSSHAKEAYRIGHALAVKTARDAGEKNDIEKLKFAYVIEAFACHFLTDLFASGHTRNQRGELELFLLQKLGYSKEKAKPLSGILTGAQHEKDGSEGLNLENKKGDRWRAYGDGHYFSPKNDENKIKVIEATQESVREVFEAYEKPGQIKPSQMEQLIPFASPINPPPLYSVTPQSLTLYQGHETHLITSQEEYLSKGALTQALAHLPEEYIHEFINPLTGINLPPVLEKVIIPHVERLTRVVWQTVGIASHHFVRQETQQISRKISEMADGLKSTYTNTLKILEEIEQANTKLDKVLWFQQFQEIKEALSSIKDMVHQHTLFSSLISQKETESLESNLWNSYLRLSRIFTEKPHPQSLIVIYSQSIHSNSRGMTPEEIKIQVTLWFRELLEYEIQAFTLYSISKILRNESSSMPDLVKKFEENLQVQVKANSNYISEAIIYESLDYIELQFMKSKTSRFALSQWSN